MEPKKLLGNVLWITKDGNVDLTRFPIDNVLKQALSQDDQEFKAGLNVLSSMCGYGRTEAGIFLMGVLVNCDDNWEKRITIVEAMKFIKTKPCADLLFNELKRVKSCNTTRALHGGRHQSPVLHALGIDPGGFSGICRG